MRAVASLDVLLVAVSGLPSPGADVGRVPAQMWAGPGADVREPPIRLVFATAARYDLCMTFGAPRAVPTTVGPVRMCSSASVPIADDIELSRRRAAPSTMRVLEESAIEIVEAEE